MSKKIHDLNDRLTVTALQVQEAINDCVKIKWLRVVLLWVAAKTLRKRGIFSFLKTYLTIAGALLITRPALWSCLVKLFFAEDSKVGRSLLLVVDFFAGAVGIVVFWVITGVTVLVVLLHYLVEHQKAKSNKDIQVLQDVVQQTLIHSGFSPNIESIDNAEDYCPIPDLYSSRKRLVSELKTALISNKPVLVYGGIKEGKSVLSCLTAKAVEGYRIVRVPFANENKINVVHLLNGFKKENKLVFILDNVKYDNPEYYNAFLKVVVEAQSHNRLFIVNSYDNFSEHSFDFEGALYEIQAPPFTIEEVNEMIPDDKRELFGPFIFSLLNGQPLLTQMMCSMLEEKHWALSVEELGDLFQFPHGMSLERKVRAITQKLVADGDAYRLLNRLMFHGSDFTQDDCMELAGIEPRIFSPVKCLNQLLNICVKEKNGVYHMSDLLKKTLEIDMLPIEKVDCSRFIVGKILSKKVLSLHDILRAISLLCSANCFNEAASIYVFAVALIQKKGLLDNENFKILKAIWLDIPLPVEMSLDSQLSVRIAQLTILGKRRIANSDYIENDIDRILSSYESKSEMKSVLLQALVAYYTVNGYVQKVVKYQLQTFQLQGVDSNEAIKSIDILFVSLNGVNTEEDLYTWFDLYEKEGFPEYELLCDGAITIINRICDTCAKEEQAEVMDRICETSISRKITNFASAACGRLIDVFSEQKNIEKASASFEKYRSLADTLFGSILVNYSYGLCLCYAGDVESGKPYLMKACENPNIYMACMVSFNAASTLAQVLGNEGDVDSATNIVSRIVENKDFERSYVEYEKVCVYGTLAYAQWQNGSKKDALLNLLKVEEYLWKEHNNVSDNYKSLAMRFDVLVLYMQSQAQGKNIDPNLAQPDYGLFTKQAPDLIAGYNSLRNFTAMYFVYYLVEMLLQDEKKSITIIEHTLQIQKTDGKGYGHMLSVMLEAYPMLLANGRKDLVEYIVLCALADFVEAEEERVIDYEQLVLIGALRCIVAYRINCMAEDVDFDDEWMYSLIDKAQEYLKGHSRSNTIVDAMLSSAPDYSLISDPMDRAIVLIYNIKRMDVKESLNLLYHMCITFDSLGRIPSAKRQVEVFAKSFAKVIIDIYPDHFHIKPSETDRYFGAIEDKHGLDYAFEIMKGFYFKMKFDPNMNKTIEDIVMG